MTKVAPTTSTGFDSERLSDREAREILAMLIRLRRRAEAGRPPSRVEAFGAALGGSRLVTLLDWAAKALGVQCSPDEYERLSIEAKRGKLVVGLSLGLPLQPGALAALAHDLGALNGGQEGPLVRKSVVRRRRAKPHDSAASELELLQWIRWQHGLGRRIADAETDVSQAVGCTREAVQKWRAEVSKIFGPDHVRAMLRAAELVRRHEAREGGRVLGMWDYGPWQSDEHFALYMTSWTLGRDLGRLAASRRAAVAKRRVANSEDK